MGTNSYTETLKVNGETVYSYRTSSKDSYCNRGSYMNSCWDSGLGLGFGFNSYGCGYNNFCGCNFPLLMAGGSFKDGFNMGLGNSLGAGLGCGLFALAAGWFSKHA